MKTILFICGLMLMVHSHAIAQIMDAHPNNSFQPQAAQKDTVKKARTPKHKANLKPPKKQKTQVDSVSNGRRDENSFYNDANNTLK